MMKNLTKLLTCIVMFSGISFASFGISEPKFGFPNATVNQSLSPEFLVSLDFSEYACEFQLDTSASFSSPLLRDTFADSSALGKIYLGPLRFGTKYYWRARAVYHKDTSAWSLVWHFTTLTRPIPVIPINHGPGSDSISILNAGVQNYWFQADTDSTFSPGPLQNVILSHNSISTTRITAGIHVHFGGKYYWRAMAIQAGDSSLWSSVYQFYVSYDTLMSPANLASNTSDSLNLLWSNLHHPLYFELQYDTVASLNSQAGKDTLVAGSSFKGMFALRNLYYHTHYFWRIRDINTGDTSAWSAARTFRTFAAPSLIMPYNNSVQYNLSGIFTWVNTGFTHHYIFELDTSLAFSTPVTKYVNGESIFLPTQWDKKYYWRVRTYNTADTSDWSSAYKFTTTPRGKAIVGPPSGKIGLPVETVIYALDFTSGLYAVLETDTTASFNSPLYHSDTIRTAVSASIFYDTLYGLRFHTKYYYRAKTYYAADSDSISKTNWFSTLDAPALNYPGYNEPNSGVDEFLVADSITGVSGYFWQLDTSAGFFSPALLSGWSKTSTGNPGGNFYFNKWYYWRFKAISGNDTSDWSQVWRFQSTDTMFLYTPANKAVNIAANPVLEWGGVIGATGYQYVVSTDPGFSGANIMTEGADSNTAQLKNLSAGATYYWKMRALDKRDTSSWSVVWSFTTKAAPVLTPPSLLSPSNNAVNVGILAPNNHVGFIWNANGVQVDSFSFELAFDNSFANPLVAGPVFINSAAVDNMQGGKIYYWRVRSRKGALTSAWSPAFKFTTEQTVGIDADIPGNNRLEIYPQPAHNMMTVALPHNEAYSTVSVRIMGVDGKTVMTGQLPATDHLHIHTSGLPAGIYLLRLETQTKIYIRKIVVE